MSYVSNVEKYVFPSILKKNVYSKDKRQKLCILQQSLLIYLYYSTQHYLDNGRTIYADNVLGHQIKIIWNGPRSHFDFSISNTISISNFEQCLNTITEMALMSIKVLEN